MNFLILGCTILKLKTNSMLSSAKKIGGIIFLTILLFTGFVLMTGPSNTGSEFNESIFSFRRITLAPFVIIASYSGFIWLIFKRPSK